MSGYLLDTNVISMLSPSRAAASAVFLAWLEARDAEDRLFLSVITIHEIEKGIALLEHKGAIAKADGLKVWLSGLITTYDDKILPLDTTAAAIGGQLEARALAAGDSPGMADAAIAGIAKAHDLTIVTGNLKHFLPFGLDVVLPDDLAVASH